jgi:hypothetical protein
VTVPEEMVLVVAPHVYALLKRLGRDMRYYRENRPL